MIGEVRPVTPTRNRCVFKLRRRHGSNQSECRHAGQTCDVTGGTDHRDVLRAESRPGIRAGTTRHRILRLETEPRVTTRRAGPAATVRPLPRRHPRRPARPSPLRPRGPGGEVPPGPARPGWDSVAAGSDDARRRKGGAGGESRPTPARRMTVEAEQGAQRNSGRRSNHSDQIRQRSARLLTRRRVDGCSEFPMAACAATATTVTPRVRCGPVELQLNLRARSTRPRSGTHGERTT